MRAEPSVKARVLGTLPPPYRLKMGGSENIPEGGWLTEFRIIGFKDGWFLIAGATPPGKEYEDEKNTRATHQNPMPARLGRRQQDWRQLRQWRHAHGRPVPGAFVDAKWTPAQRKLGGTLDTDGGPKRISPAAGIGDWWKARTACAAGGARRQGYGDPALAESVEAERPHPRFNSLKKSLPLSSMMMKAGKSSTSMRQIASMPSSGYSTTSTFLMQCSARFAAAPPIEPR